MTIHLVAAGDERSRRTLEYASGLLASHGFDLVPLDLKRARLDREGRKQEEKFKHTPEPLLASWRTARLLEQRTQPGDVVVISDYLGLGGIFVLEQASVEPEHRRRVWTIAADAAFLELRLVAGTHEGFPMPLDSSVDWEITQYRWSERVIATAGRALVELSRVGVAPDLIGVSAPPTKDLHGPDPSRVWAPGPVSRRNQSGEVLRAITTIPNARITLSNEDAADGIWTGNTWEALRHSREVLGARVERLSKPDQVPGVIVIGDPYSPPDPETMSLVADGVPVVVPQGSVHSILWPDAPTWSGSDDLAEVLTGGVFQIKLYEPSVSLRTEPEAQSETAARDRKVSVGIPVFRDVRFLGDCLASVLDQDLPPHEVLLYDDGSQSTEADDVLARLADGDARVRVRRGEHRGVCEARNRMLEEMEGDSFLFLDADDLLLPDFLSRCATVLDSDDDIWAVATWTEFFGDYEAIEAKPPFDARVGLRENPIISTSALVDMRVREAGVTFAPDLAFLYCEDWHFWSQIVAVGGRFGLVPTPLTRHRVHSSSGGYLRTELAHAIGRSRATEPLRR